MTVQRLIARGTVDERMAEALSNKGISQTELLIRLKSKMEEYG